MEVDTKDFVPRPYQIQLLECVSKKNSIIYLPTGSGKTFVAILLMKKMSVALNKPISENGKRTIFLVNTVTLVGQQSKMLREHLPYSIGEYSGDSNVDNWNNEIWNKEIDTNEIMVMTAQIFLDMLRHSYIELTQCNLLIFDECHHAVSDHPMRCIMQMFEHIPQNQQPKVLGLTATLLNRNIKFTNLEDEIKKIETTFHANIATVEELGNVLKFSTNPIERIECFDIAVSDKNIGIVDAMISETIALVSEVKFPFKETKPTDNLYQLLGGKTDINKKITNMLYEILEHTRMLGLFGGSKAVIAKLVQFERIKKNTENLIFHNVLTIITTSLINLSKFMEKTMSNKSGYNRIHDYSTDKILCLIDILDLHQKEMAKNPEKNLCGIVFVQRRFTAKILYYVLKDLAQVQPKLNFIKPNFLVGHNNNPYNDTRENLYIRKANQSVLDEFNNNACNLLCASNVIEEGIDIPMCTLVIMFDEITNYRSYIQSKGRARNRKSSYFMLVDAKKEQEFKNRYSNYQTIDKKLQELLVGKTDDRDLPTKEEIELEVYDHEVEPYIVLTTNSQATLVSSISLVNRYCLQLPQDMYTDLAPLWMIEHRQGKRRVIIELPTASPITEPILGPWMYSKKSAKRAAALETVKLLHKCGELTDNLLPYPPLMFPVNVDFLFEHWPNETRFKEIDCWALASTENMKPGVNKIKRRYRDQCPNWFTKCSPAVNCDVYLHIIEFIPMYSKPSDMETSESMIYNTITSDNTYAVVSTNRLPCISDFPIFLSSGEVTVHIKINYKVVSLNEEQLNNMRSFHYFLFSDVLKMLKPFMIFDRYNHDQSYLLAPVYLKENEYFLDNESINCFKHLEIVKEPSKEEKLKLQVTDDYVGSVVFPWYREANSAGYVVCKICDNMNAYSSFPSDKYETFLEYFTEKYNKTIINPQQPLLLVKGISSRLNMLKPRGETKQRKPIYDDLEEYFIPELCTRMSFPAKLWVKARCLPSILHRVHYLLKAEEIRVQIAFETGMGLNNDNAYEPFVVDTHCLKENDTFCNKSKEFLVDEGAVFGRVSPEPEDLDMKSLEFQVELCRNNTYPWKDEQEPIDIERNMEKVTSLELEYYDRFVSHKLNKDADIDLQYLTKSPFKLAITFERLEKYVPIELILRENHPSGPRQWEVLQALTTAGSNDVFNLERYETLGDSFLKFSISLYLFFKFPEFDEGKLTNIKGKVIGNQNLFYCGLQREIGSFMKVSDFCPMSDWRPPSICLPNIIEKKLQANLNVSTITLYNLNISDDEKMYGILRPETEKSIIDIIDTSNDADFERNNSFKCNSSNIVSDKSIADTVEALIGCYLCSNGIHGALGILEWFNIIPKSEKPTLLLQQPPPSPFLDPTKSFLEMQDIVCLHLVNPNLLEDILGYKFKNKGYLLQALTHPSFSPNRITYCYQKLEFIGDAILDFLITCHIYEKCGNLTPGELTDLRSALVNNIVFASLTIKYDFHKFLLTMSQKLTDVILQFVQYQESQDFAINDNILILLEENDCNIAEHVNVPKILGDLFESLAGAVYLDSGLDLEVVWKVFYPLMQQQIDEFSANVPKNPVRKLIETPLANPKFSVVETEDDTQNNKVLMRLIFRLDGKRKIVYGFGANKKEAKRAAAKIALRALSSSKRINEELNVI